MKKVSILLFSLLFIACAGYSTNKVKQFYISPKGNDLNTGTKKKPVASLIRAKELAQESMQSGKPAIIYLREGTYFQENTLLLDEKVSGIQIKAFNGERPVVYGGIEIKGWEKWKGNIYRAKSPVNNTFFRLYENGRSAVMARNPNVGSGFGGGLKKINNTVVGIPKEWRNYDFSNAQIYTWLGSNWFAEVREVMSVDKEKFTLTIDPGSKLFGGPNNRMYIMGVPELLDEEGEWCLNKTDGYIYYWPRSTKDINKQRIVIPTVENVVEIKGSSMKALVKDVVIDGIAFVGSDFKKSWRVFTREEGEASMPDDHQKGLIYIENADNVSVQNCKITGAGHSAVYINNKSVNCKVYGCWIEDAGFCGVYLNSYAPAKGPFKTAAESYINKGHIISNNFIYDCGKFVGGGCGIQLYQSGDNKLTHNVIAKMPRYGISYKGIRNGALIDENPDLGINYDNHFDYIHSRNNLIAYNDIFNVCRSSFDFGGIEAWGGGRDNMWNYNAIHDIDQTVSWDGWAHGIFPDDGCDFLEIKGNIVYELKGGKLTGAIMVKSIEDIVEHNIIADCAIGRGLTLSPYYEPGANNVVRKNIFYNPGEIVYAVGKSTFAHSYTGKYKNDFNTKMVEGIPVFTEVDYNLIYPNCSELDKTRENGWDKNSVVDNPLFQKKNPQWDITYTDYILSPSSPAFDLGFEQTDLDKIGLRKDFKFNINALMIRNAEEYLEAEDYNRMKGVRPIGDYAINHIEKGAWTKYENIDFGKGKLNRCRIKMNAPQGGFKNRQSVFELRLDSPDGEVIGVVNPDMGEIGVKKVKGQHNLFLVFQQDCVLDKIRFGK